MRIRWTSFAIVALVVSLVPATASAQRGEDEADVAHKIKGTVVSVDADAGTVQISTKPPKKCKGRGRGGPRDEEGRTPPNGEEGEENAGVSQRGRSGRRGGRRGRGRDAQTLTVLTDDSTRIRRARAAATLADLQEGDRVTVVILTEEETTVEEALAEPADVISAKPAKPKRKPENEDSSDEGEDEAEGETPGPPAE
jgi:hypothetical protein